MYWANLLVYLVSFGYNIKNLRGDNMYSKYRITKDGRVFSLNYNNTNKEQEMQQSVKRGYAVVGLVCDDGKRRFIGVHRLVANIHIPNPNNKPQVNHIDGNKLNNHVDNLEWVSASENQQHAFDTGLSVPHSCNMNGNSQGSLLPQSKMTEDTVYKMRVFYNENKGIVKDMWNLFNISRNTFWYAVSKTSINRTWKHVPYPY